MKNIAENFLIRFINIVKKKNGFFATFKVNGVKGGTTFAASFTVELESAGLDLNDPLEKIIDECAKIAIREFKKSDPQFEGV